MLSGVDERIEEVPHHVCLASNNRLISDIARGRFGASATTDAEKGSKLHV